MFYDSNVAKPDETGTAPEFAQPSAIARGFARRPVHPVPHDTVGRPA